PWTNGIDTTNLSLTTRPYLTVSYCGGAIVRKKLVDISLPCPDPPSKLRQNAVMTSFSIICHLSWFACGRNSLTFLHACCAQPSPSIMTEVIVIRANTLTRSTLSL